MVLLVLTVNLLLGRPLVETLLFSIALAVGLSPELLPAILSINLARGAQMHGRHGVLVRRLNAIENLGSMDVLCTDKTGTLTEGVVKLRGAYDASGRGVSASAGARRLQCGARDRARQSARRGHPAGARAGSQGSRRKAGGDSVSTSSASASASLFADGTRLRLITKGAFDQVLEVCTHGADGGAPR